MKTKHKRWEWFWGTGWVLLYFFISLRERRSAKTSRALKETVSHSRTVFPVIWSAHASANWKQSVAHPFAFLGSWRLALNTRANRQEKKARTTEENGNVMYSYEGGRFENKISREWKTKSSGRRKRERRENKGREQFRNGCFEAAGCGCLDNDGGWNSKWP